MATARGEYRFTVRESADGVPWLAAEPNNERDPWLPDFLVCRKEYADDVLAALAHRWR